MKVLSNCSAKGLTPGAIVAIILAVVLLIVILVAATAYFKVSQSATNGASGKSKTKTHTQIEHQLGGAAAFTVSASAEDA